MRRPVRVSVTRASFFGATLALLNPMALVAWVGSDVASPRLYTTAIGELRRVVLGPRALANLNTNTSLSVTATATDCDIVLKSGEALFEIRSDDLRKVRVTAGKVIMRPDASTFSVRLRDADHVDILVRRGTLVLAVANTEPEDPPAASASAEPMRAFEETRLDANQSARVSPSGVMLKDLSEAEVLRRLEWTTGYLSFRGETLDEVTEEFNRYNLQHLVVADPDIGRLRIGGKFQSTDPEGFVEALRPMGVRKLESAASGAAGGLIRLVGTRGE